MINVSLLNSYLYFKSYIIFFIESKILLNGKNLGTKFLEVVNTTSNVNSLKFSDKASIRRIAITGYNNYVLKMPIKQNNSEFLDSQKKIAENKAFTLINQRIDFTQRNIKHPQLV
jgi:hypothetical protein